MFCLRLLGRLGLVQGPLEHVGQAALDMLGDALLQLLLVAWIQVVVRQHGLRTQEVVDGEDGGRLSVNDGMLTERMGDFSKS